MNKKSREQNMIDTAIKNILEAYKEDGVTGAAQVLSPYSSHYRPILEALKGQIPMIHLDRLEMSVPKERK